MLSGVARSNAQTKAAACAAFSPDPCLHPAHVQPHVPPGHRAVRTRARRLPHSHMHLMIARQHRATSGSLVQFPVKNKLSLPLLAAALNSLISSLRRYRRSGRSSLHSSCPGREITLGPWAQESHSHDFQALPQLICQTALASSERRGREAELFLQVLRSCNMQIEFAVGRWRSQRTSQWKGKMYFHTLLLRSLSYAAFEMGYRLTRPLSMHVICMCSHKCMCEYAHMEFHCIPYLLKYSCLPSWGLQHSYL